MKRAAAVILTAVTLAVWSNPTVFADEFPHSFWAVDNQYQAAKNAGNYKDIIKYARQEIDICSSMAEGESKHDVLTSRYDEMGKSYYALGDYDSSAQVYKSLYEYEKNLGADYAERAKISEIKARQYASEMSVYTDGGEATYYGAKNEHKNGVLFGLNSDAPTRSQLGNESMTIVYQELGQPLLGSNPVKVRQAAQSGIAVEFALNCPKQGSDIRNINSMDSYLKEISDMLSQYSGIPVYMRFGAEFDVWTNPASGSEFVAAFRHVSNYFKSRNSNVAMVWSPNQASNWNINIDDYYPGDEYVDWVGVSSYAKKYPDSNDKDAALFFKNGINSEPVTALKEIVEKYGGRKPIMLSESGCGHHVMNNGATGEDTTEFALRRLREYCGYLPMVYPQIKLIAYFDNYVNNEKNDFRLSTSKTLQNEYLRLTKGDRFIQDDCGGDASLVYREITDGRHLNSVFLLSCYARKYNNETTKVTYFIDDNYVGMSEEIPFSTYVSGENYAGSHRLKAVASFADGSQMTREYDVVISDGGGISVEISGKNIEFDRAPLIYNSRTMVPMRKIFEELGAEVNWDASSKTVTGTRGDRTVKVAIGNRKMYINHKEVQLDTAPIILSDRTLVPARAVAEGMGCDVDWNDARRLVSITPKVFTWSDWSTSLPDGVDDDLYYIEKKTENRSRTRTREKEYYTSENRYDRGNYIRTNTIYGDWSDWQTDYISESDTREVDTKSVSNPVTYTYYHYCAGYSDDPNISYHTGNFNFPGSTAYHELGTFDYRLPDAPDGMGGQVMYGDDGGMYRCSNTCYRWYEKENGGSYTMYRSRSVRYEYEFWKWGDWSDWSGWSDWREGEFNKRDYNTSDEFDVDGETRTLYRFKEK